MCTLLAIISHCRAQFSDPGAVPLTGVMEWDEGELPRPRICKYCQTIKPRKADHCRTCSRCIINMDHHCPWVNNCVAIFNQKYFILFLFYTALCCIYSGVLLIARFISCTRDLRQCTVEGVV